jgi:tetratricopeptide (TPR) repeat protein
MREDEGSSPSPNTRLRDARIRLESRSGSGRPMSRQELADAANEYLYGRAPRHLHGGSLDAKYIGKLERGLYRWPNDLYRKALRHVLAVHNDADLGFYIVRQPRRAVVLYQGHPEPASFATSGAGIGQRPLASYMGVGGGENQGEVASATEWPVWFGMRVAHVVSMVHNWRGAQSDALQNLLHQEILMFDATAPESPQPAYAISRRQALVTLATLPIALGTSGASAETNSATEVFLSHCGASLTACWHLLKGSDLETVDRLLMTYLLQLEMVAQRPSKYQVVAARLASQAHRICGIVALHRNQLRAREHHCKQALRYASVAADVNSHVSALISLASTYFYDSDPAHAAETYEEALVFDAAMSPLQRSRTRAELSVVYGQLGRERDTLESVELAEQLYPTQPEHDPSYLFAEFTRASLTLEQGLSYAALAERYPTRGYQQVAADTFARVEQTARSTIPDRIRFEIINHQAVTAVLLNELETFESYLARGVEGAVLLGSKQRQKEIASAWRRANENWPREQRLKALGRELLPALNG